MLTREKPQQGAKEVFLPMLFLAGVARYLFVPLAESVVFAMIASYVLSRTLVPTLAMYLLKAKQPSGVFERCAIWCNCNFDARRISGTRHPRHGSA
jgi:multidrug efflux pump subunit AcrB